MTRRSRAILPTERDSCRLTGHNQHITGSPATRIAARSAQHSMTFTARPPSLVSLYFVDMSIPVWRIVSTTASSET